MDNATTVDTAHAARIRTAAGTVHVVSVAGQWDTARELLCGTRVPAAYGPTSDEVTCKRCARRLAAQPAAETAAPPTAEDDAAAIRALQHRVAHLPAEIAGETHARRLASLRRQLAEDTAALSRAVTDYGSRLQEEAAAAPTVAGRLPRGGSWRLRDVERAEAEAAKVAAAPDAAETVRRAVPCPACVAGYPCPTHDDTPGSIDAAETVRRAGIHVIDAAHRAPGAVLVTVQPGNARHAAAALIRAGWDTTVRDAARVLAVVPEPAGLVDTAPAETYGTTPGQTWPPQASRYAAPADLADVAGQRAALRSAGYSGPWVEPDGRRTW